MSTESCQRQLPLLICLLAAAGCTPSGGGFRGYLRTGAGAATEWSVPAGIEEPSSYVRADVAWTWETPAGLTVGGTFSGADGAGTLLTAYSGCDLFGIVGFFGHGMNNVLGRNGFTVSPYPIVKPVIGVWSWSESPEDAGLMLGCEIGLFIGIPSGSPAHGRAITLEYGWWQLLRASGGDDARFETLSVDLLVTL